MTRNAQVAFAEAVDQALDHARYEWSLTFEEAIGVLMLKVGELQAECMSLRVGDDDEEEEAS